MLWPGNIGHLLVVLSVVASLGAAWFYFIATNKKDENSRKWASRMFITQGLAVLGIFVVLFWIIFQHRYEYYYAWRHSSNSLPVYYMISCFWEGQEGSFLLWMFWNAALGFIVMRTAGKYESPVMAVMAFVQFGLSTMVLGLGNGEDSWLRIGSSPFDLLREQRPDLLQIPIMGQVGIANYLEVFKDGNGLNQLLQNYWMVIHPPTLFLGFASAMVPFAFSIAGLWIKDERGWINQALIWSLGCVGVLGTGIIMGGFWAYESLSFGGYWAWDPVENASLMPWLIMASAAHMLLISKGTGRHLFTSHLLVQLSFWLVLYATFLTRSGILGDASVHSFTDLGLSGQLLIFLFAVILLSLLSALTERKWQIATVLSFIGIVATLSVLNLNTNNAAAKETIAAISKNAGMILFFLMLIVFIRVLYLRTRTAMDDEKWLSRELWMFIGAMFLILSLVQVFSATSIPVFNKLFGMTKAPARPEDYNAIQLWLGMPVMLLMATGQYLRWRETDARVLVKELAVSMGVSLVATVVFNLAFGITQFHYLLFLFLSIALMVCNLMYIRKLKAKTVYSWGGSIAHAGFGILLAGVLVSSAKQQVMTSSKDGIRFAGEMDKEGKVIEKAVQFNRENMILYQGKKTKLGEFDVTYRGYKTGLGADSIDKYFNVLFERRGKDGQIKDSFTLNPKTQNNPKMGLLAEPSTRHYLHRDIFTHVNYESALDREEPFANFTEVKVKPGQPFLSASGKVKLVIDSIIPYKSEDALNVIVKMKCETSEEKWVMYPVFKIKEGSNNLEPEPAIKNEAGILAMVTFMHINGEGDTKEIPEFTVKTAERTPVRNYIVLKAIEFPWINLVWAGTIIMVVGFTFSVINRIKQQKNIMAA